MHTTMELPTNSKEATLRLATAILGARILITGRISAYGFPVSDTVFHPRVPDTKGESKLAQATPENMHQRLKHPKILPFLITNIPRHCEGTYRT